MPNLIRIGSIATDDPTKIINLFGSAAVSKYQSFYKYGTTNYQVPSDTVLRIGLVILASYEAAAEIAIGYGDDTVSASAVPPTNSVALSANIFSSPTAYDFRQFNVLLNIPTGKYPYFFTAGTAQGMYVQAFGVEEDT